jgi:L-amino acid N-acyltransferase YncA
MQNVIVRPATVHDISAMAEVWYEKMILQNQAERRIRLLPDGRARWMSAVRTWLDHGQYCLLVAVRTGEIIGYIIGRVEANSPGLMPEYLGAVVDLGVDIHSYQGGLGQMLLQRLKPWFDEQGVETFIVYTAHRQPVEQAFWRALGATTWMEIMWIR